MDSILLDGFCFLFLRLLKQVSLHWYNQSLRLLKARSFCMRSASYLPWPNWQSVPILDLNWMPSSYPLPLIPVIEHCLWHCTDSVFFTISSCLFCALSLCQSWKSANRVWEQLWTVLPCASVMWNIHTLHLNICVPSAGSQKYSGNAKQSRLPERQLLCSY